MSATEVAASLDLLHTLRVRLFQEVAALCAHVEHHEASYPCNCTSRKHDAIRTATFSEQRDAILELCEELRSEVSDVAFDAIDRMDQRLEIHGAQ